MSGHGKAYGGPADGKNIQQQANTTTNLRMSPTFMQNIMQTMHEDPEGKFVSGAINGHTMMVNAGDLVFTPVDDGTGRKGSVSFSINAFASFNGQQIPHGISQSEWERLYRFLGVATSIMPFTDDIPNKSGFAAVNSGSISITNKSTNVFYPGDCVIYNLPHVHERRRAEQYKTLLYGASFQTASHMRYVATLDRLTLRTITNKWADVVMNLIEGYAHIEVHAVRANVEQNNLSPDLDETQTAAIWFKQFISLVSHQALVAAVQRGIVVPAAPFMTTEPQAHQEYLNNRATVSGSWQSTQLNGAPREQVAQADFARKVDAFAENMSRVLGLVKPNGALSEDHGLMGRILNGTLYSHMTFIDDEKSFKQYVSDEFTTPLDFLPVDAWGNLNTYNPSVSARMLQIKQDAASSLHDAIVANAHSFTNKVIGRTSNGAGPGDLLHMVLT